MISRCCASGILDSKEISDSEELQKELKEASDEMLKVFLEKHGCDADVKDFTEYAKSQEEGALADNDVEAIVGGIYYRPQMHDDPRMPV